MRNQFLGYIYIQPQSGQIKKTPGGVGARDKLNLLSKVRGTEPCFCPLFIVAKHLETAGLSMEAEKVQ